MDQAQTAQEILTIVQFLKDNMASKDDLEASIRGAKAEIMTHVDSFVVLPEARYRVGRFVG